MAIVGPWTTSTFNNSILQIFEDHQYPKSPSKHVKQERIETVLASGITLVALIRLNSLAKTIRVLHLKMRLGSIEYSANEELDKKSYVIEYLLVHAREDYRVVAKAVMEREELQGVPEKDPEDPTVLPEKIANDNGDAFAGSFANTNSSWKTISNTINHKNYYLSPCGTLGSTVTGPTGASPITITTA